MKWSITYFYNIKYMKANQLPLSTAMFPPKFFAISNKSIAHLDSKGIILGLTIHEFVPQQQQCECPCEEKDYNNCCFLKEYYSQLSKLDFDKIMFSWNDFVEKLSNLTNTSIDEVILLVYEKPDNPCSERTVLKKWFSEHGIELQEMEVRKEV